MTVLKLSLFVYKTSKTFISRGKKKKAETKHKLMENTEEIHI